MENSPKSLPCGAHILVGETVSVEISEIHSILNKVQRERESSYFRSLAKESLTEKMIMSKGLEEERKQAILIPLRKGICKGPEVGSCLL